MKNQSRYSPDLLSTTKEKSYYALTMFPYPSGSGLHCGHASIFTINDVIARYKRMQGYSVLNPFGFDAFGLPTENYAIQQGKAAREVTDENKQKFLGQIQALNMSFDLERVIDTSEPEYYKRTQWIFMKLYEAGLVYKDTLRVNRCPTDQTVLANDQVVDGKCERCKTEIIQKKHPQWFIKITDYADRLIEDLDTIDRPEETKIAQKNWIGRSEGADIDFKILTTPTPSSQEGTKGEVTVTCFTTRPDTIYGVTALVVAPESTILDEYLPEDRKEDVLAYRKKTLAKTSVQRQQDLKEKTGVDSGLFALHPLTNEKLPIRYADYVLAGYGSGAVMSVPAHDQRDHEFAKKFGMDITQVIIPEIGKKTENMVTRKTGYGLIRNPKDDTYLFVEVGTNSKESYEKLLYGFPGGGIDEGEEIMAGLLREVQEETGFVDLEQVSDMIKINTYYESQVKDEYRENLGHYVLFDLKSDKNIGANLTDFEIKNGIELHWLTKEEIEKKDLFDQWTEAFGYLTGNKILRDGVLTNSGAFDGMEYKDAQTKIIDHFEKSGNGRKKVTYKLRDRSVSRQRYRGSPIPVWYDEDGKDHLVPESELPVELPLDLENYQPSGKSPLEDHPEFPKYKNGTRECDTLDTFMCSSFYFLRYPDAGNPDELIRKELADKMFAVDFYSGGKEHTVGHLLYSRFIHKFLFDQGYLPSSEPFTKLIHQGMVLGTDGRKMGKRYGNGVDPLEVVEQYGADAVRTYMMFMGPVESDKPWSDTALNGVAKFLKRVDALLEISWRGTDHPEVSSAIHEAIRGVTLDIEQLKLNTCVSKFMILVNTIYEHEAVTDDQLNMLARIIAPFATDLAEKIFTATGGEGDVHYSSRPAYDESEILQGLITLPIQINGKVRAKIEVNAGLTEEKALEIAKQHENISKWLEEGEVVKVIWVKDKILNVIVK